MTRSSRWQLSAIAAAAAAGAIFAAHAQIADPGVQAPPVTESAVGTEALGTPVSTPEPAATEADVAASMQSEAAARSTDATAAVEPSIRRAASYGAVQSAAAPIETTTIVVVPTQVDQEAVASKAWAAVAAEGTTREEVAAEAAYANKNGLIARGEQSIVNEDKGSAWVEKADQARHTRSTEQYLAKLDNKHQQFFAVEQNRLNQLALQEQQRQQALAAQQAAQQQQLAQQQTTQPTQ